jgi:hypothetical protein
MRRLGQRVQRALEPRAMRAGDPLAVAGGGTDE